MGAASCAQAEDLGLHLGLGVAGGYSACWELEGPRLSGTSARHPQIVGLVAALSRSEATSALWAKAARVEEVEGTAWRMEEPGPELLLPAEEP